MKSTDNKNAWEYFNSLVSFLKDDADLVRSYLGVSEFGYIKMFFNNSYFYISSDSKMVDECVQNAKSACVFYDKVSLVHNAYTVLLWPRVPTHPNMAFYKKHRHWNGISLLKRNQDSIEQLWFTADPGDDSANAYYTRNSKMLIAFAKYWLDNNREKLKLDDSSVLADFVDGVDFSSLAKIESDINFEHNLTKDFLNLIRSEGVNIRTKIGNAHITPREIECLHLLSKGNTVKQAANLLAISPRTAEGHINNIRSKLGFLYKSDIVKLYNEQIVSFDG